MFKSLRRLLVALAVALPLATPAHALDAAGAQAFVEQVTEEATEVLAGRAGVSDRGAAIRDILRSAFDLSYIGRLALGPTYRSLTPEQQQAYDQAFKKYILETYARRINEYGGEQIAIIGAAAAGSQDFKVQSRLVGPTVNEPVRLDWRVRQRDSGPKIIDVEIEGVSMAISQRSEFSSVVQQRGVDGLIALLEERATAGS